MNEAYDRLGEFGYGFLKSFLNEKIDNLKKFFTINKVGFIPEGIDYSDLQKVKNKATFKQLRFLIGKHRTLSIIMIGLSISSLDKNIKAKIMEEHKSKIYDKHGVAGVSILNLATTGFIEGYIKWLSEYNLKNNPSQLELINIYEKNLIDWSERSIFIQGTMEKEIVFHKIRSKIDIGKDVFFVFASKSAINVTEETIKEKSEIIARVKQNISL